MSQMKAIKSQTMSQMEVMKSQNLRRNTVEEHEENNETSNRYSLRSRSTVPELPNVMQIPIEYARRKKE